jgi:hypothetical protein
VPFSCSGIDWAPDSLGIAALIIPLVEDAVQVRRVLGDHRGLKMRLTSGGTMLLLDVELVINGDGMYLGRGWRQFARTYDLGQGHMLVFRYNMFMLNVTVFNPSTRRKKYL